MSLLIVPTHHELLVALRFPVLMAPILFFSIRFRMLTWDVSAANRRDGVDYSPEAWRLSGYVTLLFVLLAYPFALSDYREWLWEVHPQLSVACILFWLSFCGWVFVRHLQLRDQEDEKLLKDLESISRGGPATPAVVSPPWLKTWGWGNGIGLILLSVGIARLVGSLR